MINNSNYGRWDRLNAKSLDAMFVHEMLIGLNCSPIEAKAILEKVHEIFSPLFEASEGPKPGQIQIMVVDASTPSNVPLAKAKQRLVTLSLIENNADIETRRTESIPVLRQRRLYRMAEETFQQGGLLTIEDLSHIFNCGVRTLVNDLRALRKQNCIPPLRSTIKDMGRAITHRGLIIDLWIKGHEYSDIASKSKHSIESVYNYVDKFKRCRALMANGFDIHTTAFLAKVSTSLVEEFIKIYKQCKPIPHRKKELDEFIKKNS